MDLAILTEIQKITQELLKLMKVPSQATVEMGKEDTILVVLEPENKEETSLLIGGRGSTLKALQTVLGLMININREEPVRLLVDVGGYRDQQNKNLEALTKNAILRALETNQPVELYPMSSFERRLVHLWIAKTDGVESESVGEGRERRVMIKPKKNGT